MLTNSSMNTITIGGTPTRVTPDLPCQYVTKSKSRRKERPRSQSQHQSRGEEKENLPRCSYTVSSLTKLRYPKGTFRGREYER